jgi:chemotaxis-related protein WspB
MLLLTFQADESLYAVDVTRVVEVVPRVNLRRQPHAPVFLAGVFDYRGIIVPVIDLGTLLGSAPCRSLMSTRIVLVDSRPAERASIGPRPWLLGIIAERVSDVVAVKPEGVISAAMQLPTAPYLGSIVELDHEMAQLFSTACSTSPCEQPSSETNTRKEQRLEAARETVQVWVGAGTGKTKWRRGRHDARRDGRDRSDADRPDRA